MGPIFRFDNRDAQLSVCRKPSVCAYDFAVNGKHELQIATKTALEKEDRLLMRGEAGEWQEFIVVEPQDDDAGSDPVATCEWSLAELSGDYIESKRPTGDPKRMLQLALEYGGSRWEMGEVEISGPEKTQVWYHTNTMAVITRILATWGGELEPEIVVEGDHVVRRVVHIRERVGADRGKRFTYAKNLLGVKRTWGSNKIYTRVHGYGAGLPVYDDEGDETGGYSRRITFADINGGKTYVESDEARLRWGRPDGRGGMAHVVGKIEFDDEQDAAELLRRTIEWAEAQYQPQMSYEASVLDLNRGGYQVAGTCEGDDVTVVDEGFDPPVRLKERIAAGHVDRLAPENTVYTLGTVPPVLSDDLADQLHAQQDLNDRTNDLENHTGKWNDASDTVEYLPGEWLQKQMDRLNEEFNAAGQCYKFTSLTKGDIWANGPLTAEGKPEGATDHAINLCGLGFRIASKVKDGDFDWTTFGTGDGFTASLINVGRLVCGDNFLDLDTGEMRIALTAKVGDGSTSLSGYVKDVSDTAANNAANDVWDQVEDELGNYVPTRDFDRYLTFENTFNALTHDGVDQGLFAQDGQLFINASYVRTGIIVGGERAAHGQTQWDLDQGFIQNAIEGNIYGQSHTNMARMGDGYFQILMDVTTISDWTTATLSDSPNAHYATLRAHNGMIFSFPQRCFVAFGGTSSTTTSLSSCYELARDTTVNYLSGVTSTSTSATFTRSQAHFRQGWLCETSSSGSFTVNFPTGAGS